MPARPVRRNAIKGLAENLTRGPAFSLLDSNQTPEQLRDRFMLWLKTWVIPNVRITVPELTQAMHDYAKANGLSIPCAKCGAETGHYSGCSIHEDSDRG